MDLATIEPALCALAARLTDIVAACCVFENAPRPQTPDGRMVLLSWVSRAGVGIDETSWGYAPATDPLDEMTPTVEGPRYAVLQIAVEVIADQRAGHSAAAITEAARTRVLWPSSLDALRAVSLAVATVGPATQADYPADGRMVSRSLFELRLNGVASEADAAGRTSYIATAAVTGTVYDAGGVALPATLQPDTEG
jgi:hypothetical protein